MGYPQCINTLMYYYKIRKKSEPDLYVTGTPLYRSYDKNGRIFDNINLLRSFLALVVEDKVRGHDITDWEIVVLEMVENEINHVHEFLTPQKLKELLMR